MAETQNFQNHVRWYPLVHFVVTPILLLNFLWRIYRLYQESSMDHGVSLLLAVGLILLSLAARLQALKAQDRIIRLEERLRYQNVLPKDLAEKAAALPVGQMLALRFASDEELPELIGRTLSSELKSGKEIKLAVKNWRGDHLRV